MPNNSNSFLIEKQERLQNQRCHSSFHTVSSKKKYLINKYFFANCLKFIHVTRFLSVFILSIFIYTSLTGQDRSVIDSLAFDYDPGNALYNLESEVDENSGLIFYDELFWTINDSDGEPIVYGFNPNNGKLLKRIKISNGVNVDWEDLCHDDKFMYIGDFGNNSGDRKDLKFYRLEKQKIQPVVYQEITAEIILFSYEDQADFSPNFRKSDYDCEAVVCAQSGIYVFTKDWKKRETKIYKIPKTPGNHVAKLVSSFNIDGLVTAAGISPDERYLAVLGYKEFTPFMWVFNYNEKMDLQEANKVRINFPAIHRAQTEGLVFKNNDSLFISCEKSIEKTLILFDNVIYPQQMFLIPVRIWEDYFPSDLMEKNKNSLRINNE